MTSGGDAAGMNPAIKAAVDHARQLGMNPYVVYDGLEGLIDGKIKEATRELTNDMIYRGGTLLRSSRSKRFFDYEFRKQAYEHLKERNIDKLIIMGGDGSFRALNDREKQILSLRFYDGKTQMEVASALGISQAQVSRLEKGAIGAMRKSVSVS